MGIKLLLAAALLAVGVPTPAQAQEGLPAEWDQKVAAAVQDPARAGKVVEAGVGRLRAVCRR